MLKKSLLVTSIALSSIFFSLWATVTKAAEVEQPNLQMSVLSDIHINKSKASDKFEKALMDLKTIAPGYDTIAIVGDMTEAGFEVEYQKYRNILETFKNPGAEEFATMGNHEYFEPTYDKSSNITDEMLQNRFVQYHDGIGNLYYDKWIKGYHFISLSGELSYKTLMSWPLAQTNPGINDAAYISEMQYKWLEQTLRVNNDPNKPIFVFLHQPIKNTVYGSMRWHAGFDDQTRLLALLKKYPQAILFSGHSHYLLNHPKSIYQDGFTMVNTSSVEYTWYEGGAVPTLSQGFIVNVYNDRVEFKAREFSNGTWIGTTTIPIPFKETVKETNKPYFNGNSNLNISQIDSNSVTFSWEQGRDDTIIDRYLIKDSGHTLQNIWSHYWDPSERVSTTISNLIPGTNYSLDIYAEDAWDNISIKPVKVNFTTTSNVKGWYNQNKTWYYFDNNKVKKTGWLLYNKDWYYLDQSGAMQTGWVLVNGKFYFFNKDGIMKTGWQKDGTKWFYLEKNGTMKTGWLKDGAKWFYLEKNGAMKTGWLSTGNQWYFLDNSGVMATGWLPQSNLWYYLKPDGTMVTNSYFIGGKWHYFNFNGTWKK
jgi:glucan-binding YG repeat protein/predicted MPP superfamily phosphohydrolase